MHVWSNLPEHHEVLDHLLAQVVVYAVDVILSEQWPQMSWQFLRALKVTSKWLLNNHSVPASGLQTHKIRTITAGEKGSDLEWQLIDLLGKCYFWFSSFLASFQHKGFIQEEYFKEISGYLSSDDPLYLCWILKQHTQKQRIYRNGTVFTDWLNINLIRISLSNILYY